MLSPNTVCGYYLNLCGSTTNEIGFTQDYVSAYRTAVLANNPTGNAANGALDALYAA